MARLTRKNIKVFAGNANNNGIFGSLQANDPTLTNDIEQIQSLSAWGEGWNAATETSEELPPLEEIQGVEYVTTYQQAYIMQEGLPEWAATVTYYKGCLVKEVTANGFRIYNSLADNNINNPLSDTSKWKKVMDSDDLYAFDSTVVHNTGDESIGGNKSFTGTITAVTQPATDNSTKVATTKYVKNNLVGAVSSVTTSDLTASRALVSNSSGKVAVSSTTSTELGYVSGVTSAIQTQINSKQATITGGASTVVSSNLTANRAVISNGSGKIASSSVTSTELGYLSGVTSAIQTQISGLQTALSNLPQLMFPVGSIYSTVGNTNPSTILGFGTWSTIATSIITGSSDASIYGNGKGIGVESIGSDGTTKYYSALGTGQYDYSNLLKGNIYINNANGTNKTVGASSSTTTSDTRFKKNTIIGLVEKDSGQSSNIYADLKSLKTTIYIWKRTA